MGDVGWSFPLSIDEHGRFKLVSGREAVDASLASIVSTVAGERVMRPDFGLQLDWQTEELSSRITALLTQVEPRAEILDVKVTKSERSPRGGLYLRPVVLVSVEYELRRSGERCLFEGAIDWIS